MSTPYPPLGYTLEQVLPFWGKVTQKHGYNFEVAAMGGLARPVPLIAMGRFRHEAIATDPKTGYIYQTEDQVDSCIYRFTWVKLEDVDPEHDTLRYEAQTKNAAIFRRGEGMCYTNQELYWTATNGGAAQVGQIFRYNPARQTVELFVESPGRGILDYPDNLTLAPFGDLIVCEDGAGEQFLIGITLQGRYYKFARNAFNNSEFAGVCFAPDGKTMFVNIYNPGMTLAVWGDW